MFTCSCFSTLTREGGDYFITYLYINDACDKFRVVFSTIFAKTGDIRLLRSSLFYTSLRLYDVYCIPYDNCDRVFSYYYIIRVVPTIFLFVDVNYNSYELSFFLSNRVCPLWNILADNQTE